LKATKSFGNNLLFLLLKELNILTKVKMLIIIIMVILLMGENENVDEVYDYEDGTDDIRVC